MSDDLGKVLTDRMTNQERDQSSPDSEPRDAATLMLIDRAGPKPKVLLGRRHDSHKFMPGKFVFPGGRIEALDRAMSAAMNCIRTRGRNCWNALSTQATKWLAALLSPRCASWRKKPACCSASNATLRPQCQTISGPTSPKQTSTLISRKSISLRAR